MIPKPIIIDISEWQNPNQMNYDLLAKQVSGVIIRVQYGSLYLDKEFKKHIWFGRQNRKILFFNIKEHGA